jgi:hypothetical protein
MHWFVRALAQPPPFPSMPRLGSAAILHTDFVLAGRVTPEQDPIISHGYAVACGLGLLMIRAILVSGMTRSDAIAGQHEISPHHTVAAGAFGLYSFFGQVRATRVRAIVESINAASANPAATWRAI